MSCKYQKNRIYLDCIVIIHYPSLTGKTISKAMVMLTVITNLQIHGQSKIRKYFKKVIHNQGLELKEVKKKITPMIQSQIMTKTNIVEIPIGRTQKLNKDKVPQKCRHPLI